MSKNTWRKRALVAGVGLAATALALAGCAGGNSPESTGGTGDSSAIIKVYGSEPENPLFPANTNETGGGRIVDMIYAGLAYYDGDGSMKNEVAEDITVDDPSTVTVKLKGDQKFSDGSAVTSDSFINAWNYGAKKSNAQKNASWFSDIEGFSEDTDTELTGLEKVDDTTFTIKLNSPIAADFSQRLGYSAFYPLPEAAFEDPAAFGENPIGNGPYKLAQEGAWEHDVQISLVKNEEYTGDREAQNGGLDIVFYASLDGAYSDLQSGNLDVLDAIPTASQAVFESDLGDRAVNQPAAIFQAFTIPESLEHFSGEEGKLRREAISLAIDREAITKTIFDDTRTPAKDFTSPVISGWSDSIEGSDVLTFDADRAKELWAEADALSPWSGQFQIAYNSDGGHQAWADAVSNSLKNTLGIEASGAPYVDFASLRTDVTNRTIKTAFRSGWQADYPAQYNFLAPIYVTGGSSNDGDYSNPEVDELVAAGAAADSPEAATEDYEKAQQILFEDLPAIPLWYSNVTGGYADTVQNVVFGWNSVPLYYEITKN